MKKESLILPALRAKMGDWVYYITFMRMTQIEERVSIAAEIHKTQVLRKLIQRSITDRSKNIAKYLQTQEQRFFNSIIVGVYGGTPQWYELDIHKNKFVDPKELPEHMEGAIGFLKLDGDEELFAVDGQHRVVGIRRALKADRDTLKFDEVSVIFVAHSKDEAGLERTRRLFATLNRYAKPVKPSEIIALDEDNTVAIITRRLIEEDPVLTRENSVYLKSRNIPPKDKESITSIEALYNALDIVLQNKSRTAWKNFKEVRPNDETLASYTEQAKTYWNLLVSEFVQLQQVSRAEVASDIVARYRNNEGGHLLFRPMGFLAISRAVKKAVDGKMDIGKAVALIAKAPMDLASPPWVGFFWDKTGKRMITAAKESQKTAADLLYYMIGGQTDGEKLLKKYASALNRDPEEVQLPDKVNE